MLLQRLYSDTIELEMDDEKIIGERGSNEVIIGVREQIVGLRSVGGNQIHDGLISGWETWHLAKFRFETLEYDGRLQ